MTLYRRGALATGTQGLEKAVTAGADPLHDAHLALAS